MTDCSLKIPAIDTGSNSEVISDWRFTIEKYS